MYMMHVLILDTTNTATRWFEWSITVATYLNLVPFETPKATVIPVEIKTPLCGDGVSGPQCVLTVKHSGIMEFVEERVVDAADYPGTVTYLEDDAIDWEKVR